MTDASQNTVTENQLEIFRLMGLYMSLWSALELALDCATVKVMAVTPDKVIATTGGKSIADKIEFLKAQLAVTAHPSHSAITALTDALKADNIRNSIVHSYHEYGTLDGVTFTHRKSATKVLIKSYSTQEFAAHLKHVSSLALSLSQTFGETETEAQAFITAAKL